MNSHFEQYLHHQGYRLNTIRGYCGDVARFTSWCRQQGKKAEKTDYAGLVEYISACRPTCLPHTIQGRLNSLQHYFAWLISKGHRTDNPALVVHLRGLDRPLPPDVLSWEILQQLYQDYPATGLVGKRNKVMLGLLIYQGLSTAELPLLETTDLQLTEGSIHVPASGRSNSRVLSLEAHQVLQLQAYLLTLRPALLALSGKQTTRLFFSSGRGTAMSNSYTKLLTNVQKVCSRVDNLRQLRASVITHWLSILHLRQVQYQVGHRYVSSTERYRTDKLEGLQEQLDSLHPLRSTQEGAL
jgi:integrase/recombinase XerD